MKDFCRTPFTFFLCPLSYFPSPPNTSKVEVIYFIFNLHSSFFCLLVSHTLSLSFFFFPPLSYLSFISLSNQLFSFCLFLSPRPLLSFPLSYFFHLYRLLVALSKFYSQSVLRALKRGEKIQQYQPYIHTLGSDIIMVKATRGLLQIDYYAYYMTVIYVQYTKKQLVNTLIIYVTK